MEAVKEYLILLEGNEATKYMALPFLNFFREMDWLKNKLRMASEEMDWLKNKLRMASEEMGCVKKKVAAPPERMGNRHALHALDAAEEGIDAAWGCFLRAESIIAEGVEGSVAGFRNGSGKPLEKPFPILRVEKELEDMMKLLKGAFASVDRGLGRMEDAEGVHCEEMHYKDANGRNVWKNGEEKSALLEVLWPMRSLEELIGQSYDKAHEAARWVDSMRPKARRTIKREMLVPGIFWEKEKQKTELETKHLEMPPREENFRVSLRKRLETAKKDCKRIYATAQEKERTVAELNR